MKTKSKENDAFGVASSVAGEDLKPGIVVAVLNELIELPSYLWCCTTSTLPIDQLVRLRYMPCDAGTPLKITAICLPFVYAKRPNGENVIIDTRRSQLARLTPKIGKHVWRTMRRVAKGQKE